MPKWVGSRLEREAGLAIRSLQDKYMVQSWISSSFAWEVSCGVYQAGDTLYTDSPNPRERTVTIPNTSCKSTLDNVKGS